MEKLSAFITTFNNEATLPSCLESVRWADEIVVLDSYSTDSTVSIAKSFDCRLYQHEFLGYGPQKQSALDKTTHDWVLLLDADEMLSPPLQSEIQQLLGAGPKHDGYELARHEQLFWRMGNPHARFNYFLRLFRKAAGYVSRHAVHADPKVNGAIGRLRHPFYHFGETSVHAKEERINAYSSGLVEEKAAKGRKGALLMCLIYPPWAFFQSYVMKRNFLSGSAGFIGSIINAHYAFLKYAKLHEYYQIQKHGASLLPPGAPKRLGAPPVPK
jgi:glycosyltransferase involved in cell wall biosynthesis